MHVPDRNLEEPIMEIPECYLAQAYENKAEELIEEMKAGEGDNEGLWAEISRILCSKDKADIDAIEDMTLADIITRVCEKEAERLMDCGMLDDEAADIAIGAAEDAAERRADR